ncbi:MAG: hypothetical protein HGA65_14330, partial [Oscillochloris sp.]|nr:hypothetical protein [Oscillochloris sp.]
FLSWAEEWGQKDLKQIPTFCELCFWNCGLIAKVENNKVVKVDGNPLSLRGRGRLCGRGNAALGSLYDPDRLKFPLINIGKRGERFGVDEGDRTANHDQRVPGSALLLHGLARAGQLRPWWETRAARQRSPGLRIADALRIACLLLSPVRRLLQ